MVDYVTSQGVQGWRSGESTLLPPMCGRYMWVEFVGSLLCTEKFFSLHTLVFPSPQKVIFDLRLFQFTVSPVSAPALERLDTQIFKVPLSHNLPTHFTTSKVI